jgi:hypothetical protein
MCCWGLTLSRCCLFNRIDCKRGNGNFESLYKYHTNVMWRREKNTSTVYSICVTLRNGTKTNNTEVGWNNFEISYIYRHNMKAFQHRLYKCTFLLQITKAKIWKKDHWNQLHPNPLLHYIGQVANYNTKRRKTKIEWREVVIVAVLADPA